MIRKCKENGFYLGMYPHKSTEHGYDWIKEIIRQETGINLIIKKRYKFKKKKTIPKVKKNMVWEHYMGNVFADKCLCCRQNMINANSFSCGHVKAEILGGGLELENLRPICVSCNSSMGTENMLEFIKRVYPQNVGYFNGIENKKKKGLFRGLKFLRK